MTFARKMIPKKAIVVSSIILLLAAWSLLRFVGELAGSGRLLIPLAAVGAPGAFALLGGRSWGRTWCALYLIGMAITYVVMIERLRSGIGFATMMTGSPPDQGSQASIALAVALTMVVAMLALFFLLWDRAVTNFVETKKSEQGVGLDAG